MGDLVVQYSGLEMNQTKNEIPNHLFLHHNHLLLQHHYYHFNFERQESFWFIPVNYKPTKKLW